MSDSPNTELTAQVAEVPVAAEAIELSADRLPVNQFCVFRSGRERYCLPVREVEEVVEWEMLTRIPLAPSYLMGILNLRGVIVPVLDLAHREERRQDKSPTHLVVALWEGESGRGLMRVGFAADEMFGTYSTSEPVLVEQAPSDMPHACGLLRHENRLALELDLKRLAEAFPIPII